MKNFHIIQSAIKDIDFLKNNPEYNDQDEYVINNLILGGSLEYVSERLRNDKNMVLLAVTMRGDNIQYANPALKSDELIVVAAATQDFDSLRYSLHTELKVLEDILKKYGVLFLIKCARNKEPSVRELVFRNQYFIPNHFEKKLGEIDNNEAVSCLYTKPFRGLYNKSNLSYSITNLSDELRVFLNAIDTTGNYKWLHNQDLAFIQLCSNKNGFLCLPEAFRKDKRLVYLSLFFESSHLIQSIGMYHQDFVNDYFIALAINNNKIEPYDITQKLIEDEDFISLSIKNSYLFERILQNIPPSVKMRKDIVESVINNPINLYYIFHSKMKVEKDIFLLILEKKNGYIGNMVYDYQNTEIIQEIINDTKYTNLENLNIQESVLLQLSLDSIQELLKRKYIYQRLPQELREKKEIIDIALQYGDEDILEYLPNEYRYNKDAILSILKRDASIYEYLPLHLQKDKDIILRALKCNYNYQLRNLIPKESLEDEDILLQYLLNYNEEEHYEQFLAREDIAKKCLPLNTNLILDSFWEDKAFCEYAIQQDSNNLRFIKNKELLNTKEIIIQSIGVINSLILQSDLINDYEFIMENKFFYSFMKI